MGEDNLVTPAEDAEGARILAKIGRTNRWSERCYDTIHKLLPMPYVEMALVRKIKGRTHEILLDYRDDGFWLGWHIPGGWYRCGSWTIEEAENAVAMEELGIEVMIHPVLTYEGNQIFHSYKWDGNTREGHYHPISLVVICVEKTPGSLVETKTRKFFSSVPENMITRHDEFAARVLSYMRTTPNIHSQF